MGHQGRERRCLAGRRWSALALSASVLGMLALSARPGGGSARDLPSAPPLPADAETTHVLVTSGNSIGLTVYSDGFFGNNFTSRRPSMEYPNGDLDQEHLVRAGIWVGGLYSSSGVFMEADTIVSVVTKDGYQGGDPRQDTEFAVPPAGLLQRSTLIDHPFYDRWDAKSEQDVICAYREQADTMLHVEVVQEILQFSFEPYDAITIVNFRIVNVDSIAPIYDLVFGFYAEFVSGWKGGHEDWPPTGWFRQNNIEYTPGGVADTLRLLTEHRHLLDNGMCPSWAGMKLLGTRPDTIANKTVSFNWWEWDPFYTQDETPVTNGDQYRLMLNGDADATSSNEALGRLSPVTVLSVGPLGTESFTHDDGSEHFILFPGDTVMVSYALLGGIPTDDADPPRTAQEDIHYNSLHAQTAFNLNFNIPIPPPSPRLHVEPSHSGITLWWDAQPLAFIDPKSRLEDFEGFRVYISDLDKAAGFELLGEFDLVDSLFYNTSLEMITAPEPLVIVADGDTTVYPFRYHIAGLRDGFKYWVAVTSFDTGTLDMKSLESGISQNQTFVIPGPSDGDLPDNRVVVFPNPYHGDAAWDEPLVRDRYLWFAGLPPRCTIRIYSLAGDLIKTIDFDGNTYGALDVRGIYDPDDRSNPARDIPTLSGGMAAWDLTTRMDQAVATGLYVFSVENLATGHVERGKFLIMK